MIYPENALPQAGQAKPTQNTGRIYRTDRRDRLLLAGTLAWCLLAVDGVLWAWPWDAGLAAAVAFWYALVLGDLGRRSLDRRENRVLLGAVGLLAATFLFTSNPWMRVWNVLALLALVPFHLFSLSGTALVPWYRGAMVWERLELLLVGCFGNLGASWAALSPGDRKEKDLRRVLAGVLGAAGALALLGVLIPLLASGDALFASATEWLRSFVQQHFVTALWKIVMALVLTPFFFGLLYSLRRPKAATTPRRETALHTVDGLGFALVLGALAVLYLAFLAVQAAGLFGGAVYLAQRGISYADWARSGFFQITAVTAVNLTVLLAALTWSRPAGLTWRAVRLLAALVTGESLVLLASAAWRMTLYVGAYGLSFKRCLTYWGMAMMAFFLVLAAWKLCRPAFSFWRWAAPAALAGWLVLNCLPVDALVARNQVDRYLDGASQTLSVEYLTSLSYAVVPQLERLAGQKVLTDYGVRVSMDGVLAEQRTEAAAECADWRSWNLSAALTAGN